MGQYEKYKDDAGKWRWRYRASNGKKISSGESYRNQTDCDRAIAIMKASASAPVKTVAG